MTEDDFPKTELDGEYIWKCAECTFETVFMYLADSHQCETDHMFHKRVKLSKISEELKNG